VGGATDPRLDAALGQRLVDGVAEPAADLMRGRTGRLVGLATPKVSNSAGERSPGGPRASSEVGLEVDERFPLVAGGVVAFDGGHEHIEDGIGLQRAVFTERS